MTKHFVVAGFVSLMFCSGGRFLGQEPKERATLKGHKHFVHFVGLVLMDRSWRREVGTRPLNCGM